MTTILQINRPGLRRCITCFLLKPQEYQTTEGLPYCSKGCLPKSAEVITPPTTSEVASTPPVVISTSSRPRAYKTMNRKTTLGEQILGVLDSPMTERELKELIPGCTRAAINYAAKQLLKKGKVSRKEITLPSKSKYLYQKYQ